MWENRLWTEMLWRSCGYLLQSVVTMGGRRGRFRFVLFGLRWIVLYW